ncbi:hypothetical protein HU200_048335 [Digitaria exilis]|uniref:Uncharacterized protein n=1 Tax=Digitaria exilis TaxID=1010633 RepID=A0A835ED08_9POAL|nr:hypothetical protein HU200_048335 [Digitaria exilis]
MTAAAAPPASSSPPPPSAADGDGDGLGGGAARCSSPTPKPRRRTSPNRSAGGRSRKSPGSRDSGGGSVLKSVNKSKAQFKKSRIRRSGSPIRWSPRKKTESFMKRKIKQLQETDGMTASLHETLGNANPHYTRMAREKIAAREAARKATEARKAAMVEASWCRILRAARIQNKSAEEVLEKAMLQATEAFEEARAVGVMMYDKPDCPHQQYEVESSSHTGGQSTHKVTASFQTAFQVDMEVSAAVKKAFVKLANSPDSAEREEFKDLLWKINQNPDLEETDVNSDDKQQQLGDCGDESNMELNKGNLTVSSVPSDFNTTKVKESIDLVKIMLERLKALHEDELASLAVIVATSGLNAALQSERGKYHETDPVDSTGARSLRSQSRRYSTAVSFVDVQGPKEEVTSELPSLDKFLVKHLSKLEREVQDAREASRKATSIKSVAQECAHSQVLSSIAKSAESTSDLSSILVKHVSKLEKEVLEAKKNTQSIHSLEGNYKDLEASVDTDVQSRNKESEFERTTSEAENKSNLNGSRDSNISSDGRNHIQEFSDYLQEDKENRSLYSHQLPPSGATSRQGGKRLTRIEAAKLEALKSFCTTDGNTVAAGLDKIFVKSIHRLEKEKREAREGWTNVPHDQRKIGNNVKPSESLDQVLVKHVSRLEREKMEYGKRNALGEGTNMQNDKQRSADSATAVDSLDQILVKHVSRLEREKIEHEKEGGMILLKKTQAQCADGTAESLADVFVKRPSKLEQAKLASAAEDKPASGLNPVAERRRAREKELQDAWGGMGLGNSMKPHVSKIERAKAAWRAEEEQKQMSAAEGL